MTAFPPHPHPGFRRGRQVPPPSRGRRRWNRKCGVCVPSPLRASRFTHRIINRHINDLSRRMSTSPSWGGRSRRLWVLVRAGPKIHAVPFWQATEFYCQFNRLIAPPPVASLRPPHKGEARARAQRVSESRSSSKARHTSELKSQPQGLIPPSKYTGPSSFVIPDALQHSSWCGAVPGSCLRL